MNIICLRLQWDHISSEMHVNTRGTVLGKHHLWLYRMVCVRQEQKHALPSKKSYFISIICRNCHSGACCWLRPSGHWSGNLLTRSGIKKSKVFGSFRSGSLRLLPLTSALTLCSVTVVLSPRWPQNNNIKQGTHCLFCFSAPLSSSFLTAGAVSSLGGSIRLTNWEFQPPLFQPPLKHACWLCSGAMNPGILPDRQHQGPPSSQGPKLLGQPQQGTAPG